MDLTLKEKRIIFQILILIMKADHIIKHEETAFLDKVFSDFQLSIDEFDHMDDIDMDYLVKEFASISNCKKQYARQLFIDMANCDGYVDPRESRLIDIFK